MPGNTLGSLFRVTTFGESHGACVGCVIDGCPPLVDIDIDKINAELSRRKPGVSRFTSQRREPDEITILSGIKDGQTTGAPISLQIANLDAKEKDYKDLEYTFRPGHGDFSYHVKYGIRDHRGGGRASARTTAPIVAAGWIAKQILYKLHGTTFVSYVTQIDSIKVDNTSSMQWQGLRPDNDFNFADESKIGELENLFNMLRTEGDSCGAKLHVIINNVPQGLGEPVFDKIDAELAYVFMGLNAVKAVEIGIGTECVNHRGSEIVDEINASGFTTNFNGGVLAGITTGQDITANVYFKPTSSIRIPKNSIDTLGQETIVSTKGRHDPCVGIRAPVILEALAAIIICDHVLRDRGQNGNRDRYFF